MHNDKIKKLIERFIEAKNDMGLTDEQISEISGLSPSRIEAFLNGNIKHPRFYETVRLASVLKISPAEVDKIFDTNQCKCYIGIHWCYDDSELMTREDFEVLLTRVYNGVYTREQYCDKRFQKNFEQFDFCPKCGKKINWDAIKENR